MAKTARSPVFLRLQRSQLDERLQNIPDITPPSEGWIRTIRTALGMTAAQLGKRMGISPQAVLELEQREKDGSITIAKLQSAAAAFNCEIITVPRPRPSLEETVQQQAAVKARAERNQVVHTMRLESQDDGVEQSLDLTKAQETWLTTRLARLWD